jgi:hypothetical protein
LSFKNNLSNLPRAKIIIIGAITIISLAVILTLIPKPNPELCTKVNVPGMSFEQCPGGFKLPSQQNVPNNTVVQPANKPENPDKVGQKGPEKINEGMNSDLNSIVGNWNATGKDLVQRPFYGYYSFDNNNRYAVSAYLYGQWSNPIYGAYNLSPIQKILTLQRDGYPQESYNIINASLDSFTIEGTGPRMGSIITFDRR